MKVLVTGGTGFVGATIVAALTRAGHQVRLLARNAARVAPALSQHDPRLPDRVDVAVGDATDPAAVEAAVAGSEAVVHAAAVFSLDPARAAEMARTNVRATEAVLSAGVAAGCDPVVHVSSTVALMRRDGQTAGLPIGDLDQPYARSKAASERVARRLQNDGGAVVCLYPGAAWGPGDHYLGEQAERLRWLARGLLPLWPAGGTHTVDVRDVAACVTALLTPGRAPQRFVVPGHHVDAALLYAALERALGRRRPHVAVPGPLVRPLSSATQTVTRLLPGRWRYPGEREGTEEVLCDNRFDDAPARQALGVVPRDWDEIVIDSVAWLVDQGHLPERYRPRGVG